MESACSAEPLGTADPPTAEPFTPRTSLLSGEGFLFCLQKTQLGTVSPLGSFSVSQLGTVSAGAGTRYLQLCG